MIFFSLCVGQMYIIYIYRKYFLTLQFFIYRETMRKVTILFSEKKKSEKLQSWTKLCDASRILKKFSTLYLNVNIVRPRKLLAVCWGWGCTVYVKVVLRVFGIFATYDVHNCTLLYFSNFVM